MLTTNKTPQPKSQPSSLSQGQQAKHLKLISKTYHNNTESDYTEKITDLGNEYDYKSNSDYYWGPPELSVLYGTPLYNVASDSQKLALNHLFWVGNYNFTAAAEANTSIYNIVTAGVFRNFDTYAKLCEELDFETDQESWHIRTFQKIGFKTKMAIVGRTTLGNSAYGNSDKENNSWLRFLIPHSVREFFISSKGNSQFSIYRDNTFNAIAKTMLRDKKQYYSQYLRDLEEKGKAIPAPAEGIGGRIAPRYWLKFFTTHWGMSPFMACQYYSLRYTANAMLKDIEYNYVKYFRELERKGEYIPTPTAVSYYHLLDEAFHTTISQTIAKDMYKDFPKPTAYEKFVSGLMVYMMQRNFLNGFSGVLPNLRLGADDTQSMLFVYKLLKSPLFEMETKEALDWMEKCLCQEHEGFHVGLQSHQSVLRSLQKLFGSLDYQWKINREMGLMAAEASISKALHKNLKTFKQFSESIIAST
ncbi:MAG: hypothetical protein F6K10_09195 [Moorea sp. SIO2B7]|nr:hypothetical protein [Moorena sp. SIO2B7]